MRIAMIGAVLALAGCAPAKNSDVCPFVPGELTSAINSDGSINLAKQQTNQNVCLFKWAKRLAAANGDIRDIADATVGACEDAITMNAEALAQLNKATNADYVNALSSARRQAMFYVAATRAGHCEP